MMGNNNTLKLELPSGGGYMAVKSLAVPLNNDRPFWQRFDVIRRYQALLGWFTASFLLVLAAMLFFALALQQQTTVSVLKQQYTSLHAQRLRLQQQDLPGLQNDVAHLYSTERLEQIAKLYHLTPANESNILTIVDPGETRIGALAQTAPGLNDTPWESWMSLFTPRLSHVLHTTYP